MIKLEPEVVVKTTSYQKKLSESQSDKEKNYNSTYVDQDCLKNSQIFEHGLGCQSSQKYQANVKLEAQSLPFDNPIHFYEEEVNKEAQKMDEEKMQQEEKSTKPKRCRKKTEKIEASQRQKNVKEKSIVKKQKNMVKKSKKDNQKTFNTEVSQKKLVKKRTKKTKPNADLSSKTEETDKKCGLEVGVQTHWKVTIQKQERGCQLI